MYAGWLLLVRKRCKVVNLYVSMRAWRHTSPNPPLFERGFWKRSCCLKKSLLLDHTKSTITPWSSRMMFSGGDRAARMWLTLDAASWFATRTFPFKDKEEDRNIHFERVFDSLSLQLFQYCCVWVCVFPRWTPRKSRPLLFQLKPRGVSLRLVQGPSCPTQSPWEFWRLRLAAEARLYKA